MKTLILIGLIVSLILLVGCEDEGCKSGEVYVSNPTFKGCIEDPLDCDKEFRFLFNKERLKEKNISFEDFSYVTYLYLNNTEIVCDIGNIQDCFVYELSGNCEDLK